MKRKYLYYVLIFVSMLMLFFTLTSCDKANNFPADDKEICVVTFETYGGTKIEPQKVSKGDKVIEPTQPTKEGCEFDGWFVQGEKWSFIGYVVTEDMTIEAKWIINKYSFSASQNILEAGSITYKNGLYAFGDEIAIKAQTYAGYTFKGWYEGNKLLTKELDYTFNMPAQNTFYVARWTANTDTPYSVEYYLPDLETSKYSDTPIEVEKFTGTTGSLINIVPKKYDGFTAPQIGQYYIGGNGETIIKLYYLRNSYSLSINKNIPQAGDVMGEGVHQYGETVLLHATTNPGYTFDGWYDKNGQVSIDDSFEFIMGDSDLSLEAKYSINKYTVTIENTTGLSVIGVVSGNEYEFGSLLNLKVESIPSGYSINWISNESSHSISDTYSLTVPSYDLKIRVELVFVAKKENEKVYFGTYPQSLIEDDTLKSSLNNNFGILPTSDNLNNWNVYNYFVKESPVTYMFYKDIDYDGNGIYDYRGVYFTNTISKFQETNGYLTNTIYWFSYDVIEWDVLSQNNGKALIIANLLLDYQDFYPSSSDKAFNHNGGTGYANNYELSNIRKWLNDDFYNSAFNDLQKELIEITQVSNAANTTGHSTNPYACGDTNDNMFLLSTSEANSYFTSDSERQVYATEYAKCLGLAVGTAASSLGYSWWFTRSPFYTSAGNASAGTIVNFISSDGKCFWVYTKTTEKAGIRPVCWISI